MFQNTESCDQIHQALDFKKTTSCEIWRMNKKSHISMHDSYFVVDEQFNQEGVKNEFDEHEHSLTYKD